jgi:hypothetical protein
MAYELSKWGIAALVAPSCQWALKKRSAGAVTGRRAEIEKSRELDEKFPRFCSPFFAM